MHELRRAAQAVILSASQESRGRFAAVMVFQQKPPREILRLCSQTRVAQDDRLLYATYY
jgi:hypothetical protein